MREYIRPTMQGELFTANEYVSACYLLACERGPNNNLPPNGFHWNRPEYGGNVTHSALGTPGTCADETANRLMTDESGNLISLQEWNASQKKWLNGVIDYYVDIDKNGKYSNGDLVYWHTTDSSNSRRWNHWGYLSLESESHPNHS